MARFTTLTSSKVAKTATIYGRPSQTDFAEFITGQAYSETAGTVFVEECYDLPVFPALLNTDGTLNTPPLVANEGRFEANRPEPITPPTNKHITENQEARQKEREEKEATLFEEWAAEGHWSICVFTEAEEEAKKVQQKAEFTLAAATELSFSCYAGAPFWRVAFKAGAEDTKSVRIYARAFERGKV